MAKAVIALDNDDWWTGGVFQNLEKLHWSAANFRKSTGRDNLPFECHQPADEPPGCPFDRKERAREASSGAHRRISGLVAFCLAI